MDEALRISHLMGRPRRRSASSVARSAADLPDAAIRNAPLTRLPPRRSLERGVQPMNEFDEAVVLRAHRFRAESVAYRLERGRYMEGDHDRADRWYVVPASRTVSTATDRSRPGFRSIKAAADDAERLAVQGRGSPGPS